MAIHRVAGRGRPSLGAVVRVFVSDRSLMPKTRPHNFVLERTAQAVIGGAAAQHAVRQLDRCDTNL
jgi:hypothetical protein